MNVSSPTIGKKDQWTLDQNEFDALLRWLDDGVDSAGRSYLEMRGRLVAYFDRKNCLLPDELADETLNRVARRLEEEGRIESEAPAKYCYTIARYVFLENLRRDEGRNVTLDDAILGRKAIDLVAPEQTEKNELKEKMLDCLDECTGKLEPSYRDIIIQYYFGTQKVKIENRRAMAAHLGISVNALSIRACRIRSRLEACVGECAG